MRLLETCDLCEQPFKSDHDKHTMRTDVAELVIHKSCAMQLWRGAWDKLEGLAAKGLMTGGMHSEVDTSHCLVCGDTVYDGPAVKLDGLEFQVHNECYSQYAYTDTPLLAHKGMIAKGGAGSGESTSYIDVEYMADYDQLQAEYDVALAGIVQKHRSK